MSQVVQVDITYIRQRYDEHPLLSTHKALFYNWLLKRLHVVFNIPLAIKCNVLVETLPLMLEVSALDNLVWSYFKPINHLSHYINQNQLSDFRVMGNLIHLIF